MAAILLSIAVLTFWTVVGLAASSGATALASRIRYRVAPSVGMAVTVIIGLALSRFGLPVSTFAVPLTAALLVASAVTLALRRGRISWLEVSAVALPIVVSLAAVSLPMILYGFNWVSFSNDDMTNYGLGAQRLIENGYFTHPSLADTEAGRHLEENYWGLAVVHRERTGAELLLAIVASLARLSPMFVFMPFIVAAYLAIVSGAGALVDVTVGSRWKPSIASLLVGIAPLSLLGMFYQLLGQALGIALLVAAGSLWVREISCETPRQRFIVFALRTIVLSGLIAVYPELSPMLVIAYVAFAARRAIRTKRLGDVPLAATSGFVACTLLGTYSIAMVQLVNDRVALMSKVSINASSALFPYYLIPSGFSTFWGMQTIAAWPSEPIQSVIIAAGIALSIWAICSTLRLAWLGATPAAFMMIPFLLTAVSAIASVSGFALYKLAMYFQPFTFAVLVDFSDRFFFQRLPVIPRRTLTAVALAAVVALWTPASIGYLHGTLNDSVTGAGFVEIPRASPDGLLTQLRLVSAESLNQRIYSDTPNGSLAKLEAGILSDRSLTFKASGFFDFAASANHFQTVDDPFTPIYQAALLRHSRRFLFAFCTDLIEACTAHVVADDRWTSREPGALLLGSAPHISVLNRSHTHAIDRDVFITPYFNLTNHLIEADTDIGGAATALTRRDRVSLFQLEPDFFYPGDTMAALGRYLLFYVERPSKTVRMVFSFSASLQQDGSNQIPRAKSVGSTTVPFEAVGRGSARLLSPPFEPRWHDGTALVGLDVGTNGSFFPEKRTGLMRLFGKNVPKDSRRLAGFARNISVVDADTEIVGPSGISRFPEDLADPNLFYSGIYEDGWASEATRVYLTSTSDSKLHVRGLIPSIQDPTFRTRLTVKIDGREVGAWDLGVGPFDETVLGTFPIATYAVELHFDRSQRLPSPDKRIIGCQLGRLAFER